MPSRPLVNTPPFRRKSIRPSGPAQRPELEKSAQRFTFPSGASPRPTPGTTATGRFVCGKLFDTPVIVKSPILQHAVGCRTSDRALKSMKSAWPARR